MSRDNVESVKAAIDALNRENWDAAFQDPAPSPARSSPRPIVFTEQSSKGASRPRTTLT